MRGKTWLGAWGIAGLVVVATVILPVAGSAAADPTPSPAASGGYPCNTGPVSPTPPNDPPTAPGTPEVRGVSLTAVRLRWAAATDPDGIACYSVYEDKNGTGSLVATFQPAVTEGTVYLPWPPAGVASETHTLYVVAIDSLGAVSPRSGTVDVTIYNDIVTPSPSVRCDVEYASWSWDSGMTVNVGITNTGSTAIADWRLTFTFPDVGQHVTSGWSAEWSQAGAVVTARGVAWNKDIAPGQTLHIGFNGTNTGADLTPARFLINGAACS